MHFPKKKDDEEILEKPMAWGFVLPDFEKDGTDSNGLGSPPVSVGLGGIPPVDILADPPAKTLKKTPGGFEKDSSNDPHQFGEGDGVRPTGGEFPCRVARYPPGRVHCRPE